MSPTFFPWTRLSHGLHIGHGVSYPPITITQSERMIRRLLEGVQNRGCCIRSTAETLVKPLIPNNYEQSEAARYGRRSSGLG